MRHGRPFNPLPARTPLAEKVRLLRYGRGLPRWKIACDAHVTDGWLGHVENGDICAPDPTRLAQLAHALGVSYLELHDAAGYPHLIRADIPQDLMHLVYVLLELPDGDRRRFLRMAHAFLEPEYRKLFPDTEWVS